MLSEKCNKSSDNFENFQISLVSCLIRQPRATEALQNLQTMTLSRLPCLARSVEKDFDFEHSRRVRRLHVVVKL